MSISGIWSDVIPVIQAMYTESDLLPLSGLQHLVFCERQWALIHIEQQWEENFLTAEGRLLHAKADDGPDESRDGVRTVRGLALRSLRLGLSGRADIVEFPLDGRSPPLPVEYKRGRRKSNRSDEVQLCAQALCLEEVLGGHIPSGAVFYGQTRRRVEISFTPDLRTFTEQLAARMHRLYAARKTPAPLFQSKCRRCSLLEVCQPQAVEQRGSARTFLRRRIAASITQYPGIVAGQTEDPE